MVKDKNIKNSYTKKKLTQAFKIIIFLITIIVCQTIFLVWLWYKPEVYWFSKIPELKNRRSGFISAASLETNIVQKTFPMVDFSKVYPDLSSEEIDQLQRECFSIRYVYSPFVQLRPVSTKKRFVEITEAGYRKGSKAQSWPPVKEDLVIFVFGGSTTFCNGLPNEKTVVSQLENQLNEVLPGKNVQCYNFGRGYYFSTQERLLFEQLLIKSIVPDIAIFIDGLNDYYYVDGRPELTPLLYQFTAQDLPQPKPTKLATEKEKALAVQKILDRYKHNLKMIEATAKEYKVKTIFVGQPVPFLNFPRSQNTYPFPFTFSGLELCRWGYSEFEKAAVKGEFGKHFIWCGDAFYQPSSIMYADSVHYSYDGAKVLANSIITKAVNKGLFSPFIE